MALAGKKVLITGAARGIGATTARGLAARGARLALVGLEPERLQAVMSELGTGHTWATADVTDGAEQDLTAFRTMRQRLPWPMNSTTSVEECSAAFVRAIERRSRRVNVPRAIGLNHWIRPVVHSRLVDVVLARSAAGVLPRLETETAALGRSVSEKVAALRSARGG